MSESSECADGGRFARGWRFGYSPGQTETLESVIGIELYYAAFFAAPIPIATQEDDRTCAPLLPAPQTQLSQSSVLNRAILPLLFREEKP